MNRAFEQFFRGLARHAPGNDDDTLHALSACDLPESPRVYDMGAGTGSSTLLLAEELDGVITAVDIAQSSLTTLSERAGRRGLTNVETAVDDFLTLEVEPESVDLIWSEGSIYAAGWEEALSAWRPMLKPGGYVVATDCVWTSDDRPDDAVAFWRRDYPEMTTAGAIVSTIEEAGFEVVETFDMHRIGWIDYYGPIKQRLQLFGSSETSDEMNEVLSAVDEEIRVFEEYGHAWDYAFFVCRKPSD